MLASSAVIGVTLAPSGPTVSMQPVSELNDAQSIAANNHGERIDKLTAQSSHGDLQRGDYSHYRPLALTPAEPPELVAL